MPDPSGGKTSDKSQQLLTIIPFVLPPTISTTIRTRCGRGVIVPVTAAATTDVTVTHGLGRVVQGMIPLINNAGASYTPNLKYGAGPRTINTQSINATVAMTNCLIFFF